MAASEVNPDGDSGSSPTLSPPDEASVTTPLLHEDSKDVVPSPKASSEPFHQKVIARAIPLAKAAATKGRDWWDKEGIHLSRQVWEWPMLAHVALVIVLTWFLSVWHFPLLVVLPAMTLFLWQIWSYHAKRLSVSLTSIARHELVLAGSVSGRESVRWLNAAMEGLWGVFLSDFISVTVLPKLAPWFLTTYKPPVVARIDIKEAHLGDRPPSISNIKVFREAGGDNHLELEVDLELVCADNMYINVAAYLAGMSGIPWTASVTGLQLTGRVRVAVKFTKTLPFVDRVTVTFVEPPDVSCAIKVNAMGGLNAASMPLVASYVDLTIKSALHESLVWPNKLVVVDIAKLISFLLGLPLPRGKEGLSDLPTAKLGKVKSSKAIKSPVATVELQILEAENLIAADSTGTSDPYVRGVVGVSKLQTSIVYKTLNPKWNETFEIPLAAWGPKDSTLHLQVLDHDGMFSDDSIGTFEINLEEFRGQETQKRWYDLKDGEQGAVLVSISVKETGAEDFVTLPEVTSATAESGELVATPALPSPKAAPAVIPGGPTPRTVSAPASLGTPRPGKALSKAPSSFSKFSLRRKSGKESDGAVAHVKVEVIEARDLIAADRGGTSDPYVKGAVGKEKFTTKVIWKTLNPKWGEEFQLSVHEWLPGKTPLRFSVFDKDNLAKDDDLGLCEVDLAALEHGTRNDLWLKLDGVRSGEIRVGITVTNIGAPLHEPIEEELPLPVAEGTAVKEEGGAEVREEEGGGEVEGTEVEEKAAVVLPPIVSITEAPNVVSSSATPHAAAFSKAPEVAKGMRHAVVGSHVIVEIIEGKDLKSADAGNTSDPFIKGTIGPAKFSTKTIQKTLNPKWYEEFKVPVIEWLSEATLLRLRVLDQDTFSSSDELGMAELNLNNYRNGLRNELWVKLEGVKTGSIHLAITIVSDDIPGIKPEIVEVVPGCVIERWASEIKVKGH